MVRTYDLLVSPTADTADGTVVVSGVAEEPGMEYLHDAGPGTWRGWVRVDEDGTKHPWTGPTDPVTLEGDSGERLLYTDSEVATYTQRMSGAGPFYTAGDYATNSPGDGARSVTYADAFRADPNASYWSQPTLPLPELADDTHAPLGEARGVRPLNAAWCVMTQASAISQADRDLMRDQLKTYLLTHAQDPTLDYGNSTDYPVTYDASAGNPIFYLGEWIYKTVKVRDMLGRSLFTAGENATFDRWIYTWANWISRWLHNAVSAQMGGEANRLARVRTSLSVDWNADPTHKSYDGGPLINQQITNWRLSNRHLDCQAAASYAANYLRRWDYAIPTTGAPPYGWHPLEASAGAYSLLFHSLLFLEEIVWFATFPHGFMGDFSRNDAGPINGVPPAWHYSNIETQQMVQMCLVHARRGDMSLWDYATASGHQNSAGSPDDLVPTHTGGAFPTKSVHYAVWAMARYANEAWGRVYDGDPLVTAAENRYKDVLVSAIAHRFAPSDGILESSWERSGNGFPAYPTTPEHQASFSGWLGSGAQYPGLIEHGGMPQIGA